MTKRILTSLGLVSIGIVVIGKGGIWMWSWVWFVAIVCAHEMFETLQKKSIKTINGIGYGLITFSMGTALYPASRDIWMSQPMQVICIGVLSWCLFELFQKKIYIPRDRVLATLRISVFVAILFPYIFLLRTGTSGLLHVAFSLWLVWTCDVFALIFGRIWGKTKLSTISPRKTLEGTLLGFLVTIVMAFVLIWILHLPLVKYMVLAIIIGILGQLGDLHESLFKRHFNIKDSSNLLPGHGGFYDRVDSTIFVCPISFYMLNGLFKW
jgi:phosphatidate cytidylyltransferase